MIETIKTWLRQVGIYPLIRDCYRAVHPSHRLERRLRRVFFAQLVKPGDLCFDVGANVGQTIEALLACGASVVSMEPNPLCLPTLEHQFGGDARVTVVNKAVGATPGVADLHFSGTAATASLRADWNAQDDETVSTEVVTLAELIATHGTPHLLKVDVEGFEAEVFAGLDRPISVIYFEMHTHELEPVRIVLERLQALGPIDGINAVSEDHGTWLLPQWVDLPRFLAEMTRFPRAANVIVKMKALQASE